MDNPVFPFAPVIPPAVGAVDVQAPAAPTSSAAPAIAPVAVPTDTASAAVEALGEVAAVASAAQDATARIVSSKPRTRSVELDWPILFQGTLYEAVTVRRLDTREVADFVATLQNDPKADDRRWPMCDVPDAVLDALDDDDALKVDAAVADFLPRRFRRDATTAAGPSA